MANIEYSSPRDAIGGALVELGAGDNRVVVLDADLASSVTTDKFQKAYPARFFEMGIAEQSCMSAASGLAAEGFIPFFASMAMFTAGTAWTQLRQACYANRNIKVIGSHAGVDDGPDGASHHALEDLATTRTIPNLVVMTPSDGNELAAAIKAAAEHVGPVYIRAARDATPVLHSPGCEYPIGQVEYVRNSGDDFAILYEGAAAAQALSGYEMLTLQGLRGKLVSVRTVSPLDEAAVYSLAAEVEVMVTVENHSVRGGLGGAVAELLATQPHHAVLRYVGVRHVFTESGSIVDIKEKYGITGEEVARQCNLGVVDY